MMIDISPDISVLSLWLVEYGSFVLFVLLSLGIIAFPVPEETLMTVAGVLMHEGKLSIPLTVICAYAGTISGITVSYFIGKTAGSFFLHKYGRWLGITKERLEKVHNWFERFGKWFFVIAYFLPGIRHLNGLSAGTTDVKYTHFAFYAYGGAVIWVSLFLSLGYFVGDYVFNFIKKLEIFEIVIIISALIFIIVLILIVIWRLKKQRR